MSLRIHSFFKAYSKFWLGSKYKSIYLTCWLGVHSFKFHYPVMGLEREDYRNKEKLSWAHSLQANSGLKF
jgi:hypothetical protein